MGKFTIVAEEDANSPSSAFNRAEAAQTNQQKESPSDSVATEEFTLRATQQARRKKAAPPRITPTAVVEQAAPAPGNYQLWSQVLIGSANTVVVTWLGTECTMEKREADMMEPPLARMLSRMPVSQAEQFSKFVDPMVMLIALGMWGNRIVRIKRAERGSGITQDEFNRAIGVTSPASQPDRTTVGTRREPVTAPLAPDQTIDNTNQGNEPSRVTVPINPNGVPTAITSQMGDF